MSTTAILELVSYSLFSESCPFYSMREVDIKGGSVCFQGGLSQVNLGSLIGVLEVLTKDIMDTLP